MKWMYFTVAQLLTIDGELLSEIICSRTNVQLMAIQEKYAEGKWVRMSKLDKWAS